MKNVLLIINRHFWASFYIAVSCMLISHIYKHQILKPMVTKLIKPGTYVPTLKMFKMQATSIQCWLSNWYISFKVWCLCNSNSHYWNPMDLISYLFVNFVKFLVSPERKCHVCDIIVLNKLTLTRSKLISFNN